MDAKDLLSMLKEAVEEATTDEREDRPKRHVGELDDELIQKHRAYRREKKIIKDKAELKAKELKMQFQREMDAYLEDLQEESEKVHEDFWNEVYTKNGLDPNFDYNVNIKEKKVYQYIDVENPFNFR